WWCTPHDACHGVFPWSWHQCEAPGHQSRMAAEARCTQPRCRSSSDFGRCLARPPEVTTRVITACRPLARVPNPPAQVTTSGSNRSNGWKPLAERSRKSTESPRIGVRSHDHCRSILRGHEWDVVELLENHYPAKEVGVAPSAPIRST